MAERADSESAYAERMLHYQRQLWPHLEDDDVMEIRVNPHDLSLWVEARSRGSVFTGNRMDPDKVRAFLNVVADRQRETLSTSTVHIQAQLPLAHFRGARLQGLLPDLVKAPCYVIHKRAARLISLNEYVSAGIMTLVQRTAIEWAITLRKNILVAGGTGSGKTTLVGAILKAMIEHDPTERFVLLEDTPELQCQADDRLEMQTTVEVDLAALVKLTLRVSPGRIIVGEVRDHSALHLMDAWVTGHPGGAGILHATTPLGALRRMDRLARRAAPVDHSELVAEAIDLVVMITRRGSASRRVTCVAHVVDELDTNGTFVLTDALTGDVLKAAPDLPPEPLELPMLST